MSTEPSLEHAGADEAVDEAVDDSSIVDDDTAPRRGDDDATIVRPRAAATREDVESDLTVVRPRPPAMPVDDDATRITGARHGNPRPHAGSGSGTGSGSVALPVEETGSASRGFDTSASGLDPERRIAPVPGVMPWESVPLAERGVRAGTPVVYGARPERRADTRFGSDEVHRALGDPPPVRAVLVREARQTLPSMERRARRTRTTLLIGFVAAVVIAVTGLVIVANIAFG